jgi:hypothetical protein
VCLFDVGNDIKRVCGLFVRIIFKDARKVRFLALCE